MQIRWAVAATVVTLGLACAGPGSEDPTEPAPDPSPKTVEPDAPEVAVPDLLTPFLPPTPAPSEVTVVDGVHRARYDDLSVEVAVRGWGGPIGVVSRSPKRVIGASWSGSRVVLAVADDLEPGLLISVHEEVPDLGMGQGSCEAGQVAIEVPWPGGAVLTTCLVVGADPEPIGAFQITRSGIPVVEGIWSAGGQREGLWTVRGDGGDLAATGAYVASVPVGMWTFVVDGVEHEVAYIDGLPTEVPSAQLPSSSGAGAVPRTATFEVLDVDLTSGWVAASERWTRTEDPASPVRACAAAGRLDPKGGWRLVLLRPGIRTPVGSWTVYDAALEGQECTTEDAAAAAISAANAAFVERGLDPLQRTALTPPTGGATPFEPGTDPTRFAFQGHQLSVRGSNRELTLEDQLRIPDLLAGSWVSDPAQTVRSASVSIDGQEVDALWIRWPAGCPGGATIDGAIVDRDQVALVYRSVDVVPGAPCSAAGPLWTVGGPIHVGPSGDGEEEDIVE